MHVKKYWGFLGIGAISLAMVAQMAFAQQGQPRRGQGVPPTAQQTLDRMAKALDLTEDQKKQLQPILEDRDKQMTALRDDTSMTRQDRMAKMRDIQQQSQDKIRQVLTADQQKKMDEMRNRVMERRQGRMGQGRWGGRRRSL